MTLLRTHAACEPTTAAAVAVLDGQIGDATDTGMLFVFYGCTHDDALLHRFLKTRFPHAALLGGTSSGGMLTEAGFHDGNSIALLRIDDSEGDFGVASAALGDDPAATAERLIGEALADCGCGGELPELVWIYQAPGHEEEVLEGLRRVVGDRCPIIGGSSGDDEVTGKWRQLGPDGPLHDGLVVGVLFPSSSLSYAFQGGYEPTGCSGVVTSIGCAPAGPSGIVTATDGRDISMIDDLPAAAVYNDWCSGQIADELATGGTILAKTTMFPLATDAGREDGVSQYLLIHPESVTGNGTLRTFCNVQVGARLYAMRGDRQRLIDRAGRVSQQARRSLPSPEARPAGALLVYCGGCKLAVGDQIADVGESVAQTLGGAPFIACFTFGEQGPLIDRNVHGNLMISAVVFGA